MKSGKAKIAFNGTLFHVGDEQLIILPPESLFNVSITTSEADLFCIAFSCSCKRLHDIIGRHYCTHEQLLLLSHILNNKLVLNKDPLDQRLPKYDEFYDSNSYFGTEQIIKEYLELVMIDMINNPHMHDCIKKYNSTYAISSEDTLYNKICNYLNDNLDECISVGDICKKFFISSSTIKKMFNSRNGCGVIKYYHILKIEKAKEYIKNSSMNFTEISEALGFSSLHYFSRYFKIITGVSPTEFALSQSDN